VLRAAGGSVLYLALIALLSLGIASAVRDGAAAIGIVLGLLYLFPILGQVAGSSSWHRHLERLAPMTAGLAIQATTDPAHQSMGRPRRTGFAGPPRRFCWPAQSCSASATPEQQSQGHPQPRHTREIWPQPAIM
jgi:hypothetical protein